MAEAGGLTIPPKNEELRREEEEALHGSDLNVHLSMPDGTKEVMTVKNSTEVGYVKVLLAQRKGLSAQAIVLKFNGKPMIDPMSFCDHAGFQPGDMNVEADYCRQ